MAEDRIYVGSRARVWLPAVDVTPDGEETLTPANLTVQIWDPDGNTRTIGILTADSGSYRIDFAVGELDKHGNWYLQGADDGYLSKKVKWKVWKVDPKAKP